MNGMHASFPAVPLIVASFSGIFFRLLQGSPNTVSVGTDEAACQFSNEK